MISSCSADARSPKNSKVISVAEGTDFRRSFRIVPPSLEARDGGFGICIVIATGRTPFDEGGRGSNPPGSNITN